MKKKLVLTMVASLAIGLCACGGKSEAGPINSGHEAEQETVAEVQDEEASETEETEEDESEENLYDTVEGENAEETEAEEADYIEEPQENSEEEKAGDEEGFVFTGGLGSTVVEKYECLGIRYEIHKECAEITGILNENAVFQPEIEYDGNTYPVVALGKFFLRDSYDSSEFVIPDYIKVVLANAFDGSDIESITIPSTVKYIEGKYLFNGCKNLKNVTFEGTYEVFPNWEHAFDGCKCLESVIIPYGAKDLTAAFSGCESLTSVSLPETVESLGAAFSKCSSLSEVVLPEGLKDLGEMGTFEESGITSLIIPENVTDLGILIFNKCSNLEEIIIPDSVTEYGNVFSPKLEKMENLKTLKFSNEANFADRNFYIEAPNLELVIFPDNVTEIRDDFFDYVTDKSKLTIQVPEKTVDYFQSQFPDINVVAKEN